MKNKLYRKLFLYFVSIIVLTTLLIGIVTYTRSSAELDRQLDRHMSQIVQNALNHTDLYIKSYDRTMISLLTNRELKKFVDLPNPADHYDYYHISSTIKDTVFRPLMERGPELLTMYLLSYNGHATYSFGSDFTAPVFSAEEKAKQLTDLRNTTKDESGLMIHTESIIPGRSGSVVRMTRLIKGLSSTAEKGVLAMEVRSQELSSLWKGIDLGERGYFYIADASGHVVYQPEGLEHNASSPAEDPKLTAAIMGADEESFKYTTADGEQRVFMTRMSPYSGWRLVASMPLEEWRKPIASIRSTVWTIGLISLVAACLLAYRFTRSITQPIQTIIRGMRQTEQGRWIPLELPKREDELTEMMQRYNLMVTRLSELIERVYETELQQQKSIIERQNAEFQALQLQINPHFMYNTLETIVCYAEVEGSSEITEMVSSLGFMMRYSLLTSLEEITVANELNHVLNYMTIMKHRHDLEFDLRVEVPHELLLYKMVRLTLQPLIENAFQHAFPDGIEASQHIMISAGCDDDSFWVSVTDNGIGMTDEQLREVTARLSYEYDHANQEPASSLNLSGTGGIGLLNVHRRIQLVFGENYGLRVTSAGVGTGTTIRMVMPCPPRT
ncbi:sensor histidine kinase YesM [Paenibacillus lautus]|uniref:cache domain-containing sensor histidine kinase n=1 Tax=Paenibacillus lautus TaxID=1401 RepID=UPI001B0AB61D|nr:sensor histidine kinase [Paenibacillus lautus]GIO98536.1 sensor histidine kinase YesM [Paenibacillus lautus]